MVCLRPDRLRPAVDSGGHPESDNPDKVMALSCSTCPVGLNHAVRDNCCNPLRPERVPTDTARACRHDSRSRCHSRSVGPAAGQLYRRAYCGNCRNPSLPVAADEHRVSSTAYAVAGGSQNKLRPASMSSIQDHYRHVRNDIRRRRLS